jgi:AcrR family transcriptional regulator
VSPEKPATIKKKEKAADPSSLLVEAKGKLREPPTGGKPLQTYERLIVATGELLGEVGFERLTTNAICARAGLSPPALYHYFNDKYDILEVMARRLLKRQNDAYAAWLFKGGAWSTPENATAALEEWFGIATEITVSEPGAIWTMRALKALPNLAHVRLESQRQSTDQVFELYRRIFPDIDPTVLWSRLRVRTEFGWAVDELALEEDRVPRAVLLREAARLLSRSLKDDLQAK